MNFQPPADSQAPRASRRLQNGDFELLFSIYQLLAKDKYTLAATQYIAKRFSREAGSRGLAAKMPWSTTEAVNRPIMGFILCTPLACIDGALRFSE